jgi:release factor glutamine methyltransferase
MYNPREDSFLVLKHIKEYAKGFVLEVGTGSGILAKEAAKYSDDVTACDINKELVSKLKRENKDKHITFVYSNLFSEINGKFDLIIFNPPYLPSKKIEDIEVDGGRNGTEIIERFLKQAKTHLNKDGKILLLCSSLNKDIEKLFKKWGYAFRLIDQEAFFLEKLFLYELKV